MADRSRRSSRADLIVGIDVGMTCTAVAYTYGPEWPEPKTIQRWPGKLGHELHNKVNTCVSYDIEGTIPRSWGFFCNPEDETSEYNSLFKLHLDPSYNDPTPNPPATADARRWYLDYLGFLYSALIGYFNNIFPRFDEKRIDFVFSCPVTWRVNVGMIPDIENLIHKAGFGQRNEDTACVYLTEAEAAAIHASKGILQQGDVFLVVDAGGGTTDINALKVVSAAQGRLELFPLSWTEGAAVGSTLIDFKVRSMVQEKLSSSTRNSTSDDDDSAAARVMKGTFDAWKCSFGAPGFNTADLILPTSQLRDGRNEDVVITKNELQKLFDTQLTKMFALIDKQFYVLAERHPGERISYMVLSGGFSSSPYVQACIRRRYITCPESAAWTTVQILLSSEPQLAVAHGLVMARTQVIKGAVDTIPERCCPVSFGILTREVYDPMKHRGEKVVEDPFDRTRWAEGQINWILKQGEMIRPDYGVSERYSIKIAMGHESLPWSTMIVTSDLPPYQLPRSLRQGGARLACKLETVLNARDMKRKNRHWWEIREEYNRAEFIVRMIVGAGVRFEIWSLDGTFRSRSSDEISVHWNSINSQAASSHVAELQAMPAPEERRHPAELAGSSPPPWSAGFRGRA